MAQDDETARKLLVELGLFSLDSPSEINDTICLLSMRQMDRLKLMLQRFDGMNGAINEITRLGIKNNDFRAFAEAIVLINKRFR